MIPGVPGKEVVIKDPNYRPLIATVEEIEGAKLVISRFNELISKMGFEIQLMSSWCVVLETRKAELERSLGAGGDHDVIQEDVRQLLVALGLGDHARPASCHQVVQEEIIPAIYKMRDDALEEAAKAIEDTDVEKWSRGYEGGDDGRATLRSAAATVRAMKSNPKEIAP